MPTVNSRAELKQEIVRARASICAHLHRTPLLRSAYLSSRVGCNVYLKAELFQKTGSFKVRGMLWTLQQMPEAERIRGVVTYSAGNAGQGLAYAAGLLGMKCCVVMPVSASPIKAEATRGYGAEVIMSGNTVDCQAHCQSLVAERGMTFVSPFDRRSLMIGHASMALEIFEDLPDTTAIVVSMGGGSLAGAIALAGRAIERDARLIGVEPHASAVIYHSLAAGRPIKLEPAATVADGLAAPHAGEHCFEVIRDSFEDVVCVSDAEILEAMRLLMTRCKLFAEPAGAASLAGLLGMSARFGSEDHVVCIVSGGNLDLQRLGEYVTKELDSAANEVAGD